MSQAQGIFLSHPPSTSRFRLIELPPGLDTLLTSESAPRLTLTSSDDTAVLKVPDGKTYALRQKNTSNALILLKPSGDGLEAVGTVHETVELEAVPDRSADGSGGAVPGGAKNTGSKGKWHERFGKGR